MKKLQIKSNNQKIGIFGGSFDPIHIGHLVICNFIKEEFGLDKVIFVPAHRSPHKKVSTHTTPQERYNMVKLATEGNDGFEISDYEIKQDRAVYSIETIKYFKQLYPESELFMIIGADSYKNFSNWKNPEEIKNNVKLVIASRDRIVIEKNDRLANTPNIGISSSMIRERITENLSIKYLVNSNVEHYIYENRLYK